MNHIFLLLGLLLCACTPLVFCVNINQNLLDMNLKNTINNGWRTCDSSVLQASGYISVPGSTTATHGGDAAAPAEKNIFYWMFGPRRPANGDNRNAPVVLWFSGGPGCSSMMALMEENGPCRMNETSGNLYENPYAWNDEAYLIYVDQPVGVGYSYTTDVEGNYVRDEAGVAADMYAFLQAFSLRFNLPSLQSQEVFLVGESYAGHYIPAIADYIREQNELLASGKDGEAVNPNLPINLKGIFVGNGWTDPHTQIPSYLELVYDWCALKLGEPCISEEAYTKMKALAPICQEHIQKCNNASYEYQDGACVEARVYCNDYFQFYEATGRNVYDIRKPCVGGEMCYVMDHSIEFFNTPAVRAALGAVDASLTGEWTSCQHRVGEKFRLDVMKNFNHTIPSLLGAGVRVMVFAGDMDFICNWIGNKEYLLQLNWSGKKEFNEAYDTEFAVDGRWAGKERFFGNLSFVQVYEAGHMVPLDQPEVALFVLNKFLHGERLISP